MRKLGEIAADRRPDGGCQRGDKANDRRNDNPLVSRKHRKGDGKHRGDHRSAHKVLQRPQRIISLIQPDMAHLKLMAVKPMAIR